MAILKCRKRGRAGVLGRPIQIASSLLLAAGCAPGSSETAQASLAPKDMGGIESVQVASQSSPSPAERHQRHPTDAEGLASRKTEGAEMARLMSLTPDPTYEAWLTAIHEKINDEWKQLDTDTTSFECQVRISLAPGMEVVNAEILRCDADNETRSMIILAVGRASPLPPPPEPELFERLMVFEFKPAHR